MAGKNTYKVEGMKCAGCVANARTALEQLDGYEACDIDLANGTAEVEGDVAVEDVINALNNAGYPTVLQSL